MGNMKPYFRSSSPSTGSSRLNAVESYIVTCILSIFGAIVEYAIVLTIRTVRPDNQVQVMDVQTVLQSTASLDETKEQGRWSLLARNPRMLDLVSIVVFSTAFITYNLYYLGSHSLL